MLNTNYEIVSGNYNHSTGYSAEEYVGKIQEVLVYDPEIISKLKLFEQTVNAMDTYYEFLEAMGKPLDDEIYYFIKYCYEQTFEEMRELLSTIRNMGYSEEFEEYVMALEV